MDDSLDLRQFGGLPIAQGDGETTWNFGWVNNPTYAASAIPLIEQAQGFPVSWEDAYTPEEAGDDDSDVFLWKAEEKLRGTLMPSWNQSSVGSCFPAGTLIRMADGCHKPIEQVVLLDEVLTAEGNTGRVTTTFVKEHKGEICTLVMWGHSHLKATPEHPILTKRGYVPVGEVVADDWVAMPRYVPERAGVVLPAEHVSKKLFSQSGSERKFHGVNGRGGPSVMTKALPDVIELNEDTGLIFGLFLAEGSCDRSRVVWTFNIDEKDTLAKDLSEAIKRQWDIDTHTQERGNNHTCKVVLYGTNWARMFDSLCSSGAGNKRMHPDLTSGPKDFLQSLWKGWLSGDGYSTRRDGKKNHGVTVSHSLALGMFSIGLAVGERPTINLSQPKLSHGVKSRQPRWDVKFVAQEDTHSCEMDESCVWRRVRWVNREDFDGWVYNFEVEGDNSYVAEGVGVHNCVAFGNGRAVNDLICISALQGILELPEEDVATEPIYGGSRVEVGRGVLGNSDGSLGSWAAGWLLNWGVLLRKVYGSEDLREYNTDRCRSYGVRGCPDSLEPIAKQYPVKGVALVTTGDALWQALGSSYPVAVCSNRGFTTTLQGGFCEPSGSWGHCMEFRGRFIHPTRGKCVIIQNSWADYLKSKNNPHSMVETRQSKVQLPDGCFATTLAVAAAMVAQRDSYALSNVKGFPTRRLFYW